MDQKYEKLCKERNYINEHPPTLYTYAKECESIIELGVRGVVSSWALIKGLSENGKDTKKILLNDVETCNTDELLEATKELGIDISYEWKSDLTISTRILEGQSDPDFTHVHIVFETRANPHGHGVFRVCGTIPSPLTILGEWRESTDNIFLIRKEPCRVQHLTNLQLNLYHMLVT